eukprot:jgi/Mesvir1/13174/Mv06137-RA.1
MGGQPPAGALDIPGFRSSGLGGGLGGAQGSSAYQLSRQPGAAAFSAPGSLGIPLLDGGGLWGSVSPGLTQGGEGNSPGGGDGGGSDVLGWGRLGSMEGYGLQAGGAGRASGMMTSSALALSARQATLQNSRVGDAGGGGGGGYASPGEMLASAPGLMGQLMGGGRREGGGSGMGTTAWRVILATRAAGSEGVLARWAWWVTWAWALGTPKGGSSGGIASGGQAGDHRGVSWANLPRMPAVMGWARGGTGDLSGAAMVCTAWAAARLG